MNQLEIKIAQLEKDRAKLLEDNRTCRQKNINFLKQLIKYVEDPKHSENECSEDFLSEGEMLDIVVDQLKKFTAIRHRLNNPKS